MHSTMHAYHVCMHPMHIMYACILCMHAHYVCMHIMYACILCMHAYLCGCAQKVMHTTPRDILPQELVQHPRGSTCLQSSVRHGSMPHDKVGAGRTPKVEKVGSGRTPKILMPKPKILEKKMAKPKILEKKMPKPVVMEKKMPRPPAAIKRRLRPQRKLSFFKLPMKVRHFVTREDLRLAQVILEFVG